LYGVPQENYKRPDSMPSDSREIDQEEAVRSTFHGIGLYLLLATVGAALSVYLLYHHTAITSGFQTQPSFCSLNELLDCDSVAKSSYSEFLGMPVAGYALIYYIFLLGFLSFSAPTNRFGQREFSAVLIALAILGLIPTVVMGSISFFAVKKLCLFCIGLYALSILFLLTAVAMRGKELAVGQGIRIGFSEIGRFLKLASQPASSGNILQHVTISALLFLFILIYFAPSYIIVKIFAPLEREMEAASAADAMVKHWASSPVHDISVDSSQNWEERDFSHGPADSKIEMVIFSDFECPICKRSAPLFEHLAEKYHARLIFKNFPLDEKCNPLINRAFHEEACAAAVLARCAGSLGEEAFWAAHDAIYALPQLTSEALDSLAPTLGLSPEQMSVCRADPAVLERVRRDAELGESLQVRGTPTVFINGRALQQALPEAIENILKAAGK
jgi:uncharacterized membrane protein/predicted DsbA family dithiol-disulfide isomerase